MARVVPVAQYMGAAVSTACKHKALVPARLAAVGGSKFSFKRMRFLSCFFIGKFGGPYKNFLQFCCGGCWLT